MKAILAVAAVSLFVSLAHAQTPGAQYQSHNFQYLTATLDNTTTTSNVVNAWNAENPPKWFSFQIAGLDTPIAARLEGSLDNSNWRTIAVTTSATGNVSNQVPLPALYFRVVGTAIPAGKQITATAIGVW